jgi:bacteriocin-like protein
MTTREHIMTNVAICELSSEELDQVSGGEITVVAEKGYVGIEVSIGGYGVAVWATEGSVCGKVVTPHSNHSGCTP